MSPGPQIDAYHPIPIHRGRLRGATASGITLPHHRKRNTNMNMNKDAVRVLAMAVDEKLLIDAYRKTCKAYGEDRRGRVAATIIAVLDQVVENAERAQREPAFSAELSRRHAAARRALEVSDANVIHVQATTPN